MIVRIGTKNETKLTAVRTALSKYPDLFPDAVIEGVAVKTEEFGHPKSLEQTIEGATDRAKQAFAGADYGFGLEGGLMAVPGSASGYMETNACVIYDGKQTALGLSYAFEWPPKVMEMILKGEADASEAFRLLGYTQSEKMGAEQGGISGMLTGGRMGREHQNETSIVMALIRYEHAEMYAEPVLATS